MFIAIMFGVLIYIVLAVTEVVLPGWMITLMWLSAILGFLTALPDLIKLYNSIVKAVGRARVESAINDLDKTLDLVVKSREPNLTIEAKRELRKKALTDGADVWNRLLG